jgi:hypothetical protein
MSKYPAAASLLFEHDLSENRFTPFRIMLAAAGLF